MTQYRLGSWNLYVGKAIDAVPNLMRDHRLDALAVQEIAGGLDREGVRAAKVRELRKVIGSARLRVSRNREAGIVVAKGVRLRNVRRHVLTQIGWKRGKGRPGLHPRRETISCRLGPKRRRGIRFGSMHVPPGPDSWDSRRKARKQALKRIGRIGRRWNKSVRKGHIDGWVFGGDTNHPASHSAIKELAKTMNARVVGNGVDIFLVSNGLTVDNHYRVNERDESDHTPRVLVVSTRD